jgi:transcriptional regulator with XRE-family HTH domain
MPNRPDKEAYRYAERIRARLGRVLQEALEKKPITKYGLEQKCGITREMIGRVESGKSIPTLYVIAQICHGLGLTLTELVRRLEDDASEPPERKKG